MFYEFIWIIGVSKDLAISEQYLDPLESIGLVVYPSWLLVMRWIVPSILYFGTLPKTKD